MQLRFLISPVAVMVLAISASAEDSPNAPQFANTNERWSNISKYLNTNEQYFRYGDQAGKLWSEISEQPSLPEYRNRFYGKDIIVKMTIDGKLLHCSTSDPTLFWELLLIPSQGNVVRCYKSRDE